jgi:hypothetical protein
MGDVLIPVAFRGIVGSIERPRPSRRGPVTVTALADTGSSRTVVSTALARRAGIVTTPLVASVWTGAGSTTAPLGWAMVEGGGCDRSPLLVAISDELTGGQLHAILGHDYMQAVPMLVRPRTREASCRLSKANPGRRLPPRRRDGTFRRVR